MSWAGIFLRVVFLYSVICSIFAGLALLDEKGIGDGSFGNAFFWIVQTLSTIGYGTLAPQRDTILGNILGNMGALLGNIFIATVGG